MANEMICGWRTGTAFSGPRTCGKPAKAESRSPSTTNGLVCGVHARSARAAGLEVTELPEPDVRPGQVWADTDPRSAGRTLRVDAVQDGKAVCAILTNPDEHQRLLDSGPDWYRGQDMRGRTVRIRLGRFRPTSTGYRLLLDVVEG